MNNLKIIDFQVTTLEQWRSFYDSVEYATFFESSEWALLWQEFSHKKYKAKAFIVKFNDGLIALFPCLEVSILLNTSTNYLCSIQSTYTQLLSQVTLSPLHFQVLETYLKTHWKNFQLTWSPFCKNTTSENIYTHVLNLREGSIFQKYSKGHKSSIKKAEKTTIKIIQASDWQEWKSYFDIYLESQRRWNTVKGLSYTIDFFRLLAKQKNVKLHLAYKNDQLLAGAICLLGNKVVNYWHGACIPTNDGATNFLIHQLILKYQIEGFHYFDFGSSAGLQGVERFKKGFGAKKMYSKEAQQKSSLLKIIQKIVTFSNSFY